MTLLIYVEHDEGLFLGVLPLLNHTREWLQVSYSLLFAHESNDDTFLYHEADRRIQSLIDMLVNIHSLKNGIYLIQPLLYL